jgi:hypothetical protein
MEERSKVEIPEGITSTVKEIISPIIDEINAGGLNVDTSGSDESMYGHALRNLAQSAFGLGKKPEADQLNLLRQRAQRILDRYGPNILEMMDPKLLEALGIVK